MWAPSLNKLWCTYTNINKTINISEDRRICVRWYTFMVEFYQPHGSISPFNIIENKHITISLTPLATFSYIFCKKIFELSCIFNIFKISNFCIFLTRSGQRVLQEAVKNFKLSLIIIWINFIFLHAFHTSIESMYVGNCWLVTCSA